jgi:hypothetical protein
MSVLATSGMPLSSALPFKLDEQQLARERIETAVSQNVVREKHLLQHKIEQALEQQKLAQKSSYERMKVQQGQIVNIKV